jgi:ribosomal protein S18 acetylase RimI-like enzyme
MIRFSVNDAIDADQFVGLLERSGLAPRRPVHDRACVEGMVEHADLTVTAWSGSLLVGVARSVTDFSYCCYVSDLAVDRAFQRTGIGKQLLDLTQAQVGPLCKLLLFSAPDAQSYYPHVGFCNNPNGWVRE